ARREHALPWRRLEPDPPLAAAAADGRAVPERDRTSPRRPAAEDDCPRPGLELVAADRGPGAAPAAALPPPVALSPDVLFAERLRELVVDGDAFVARRLAEDRLVQAVEASQLLERPSVMLDPEVDDRVGELRVAAVLLDHEQGRRLLAATIAAGGLGRVERGE